MSAVVDPSNAPAGKLPLWQTIRLSYATYIQHFAAGLRIAALWLPPIAFLALIAGWLQATLLAELAAGPRPQIDVSQPLHLLMLGHVLNLVIACAAVSSAVAWHRLLLSKEEPAWTSAGNVGTRNLWRYVGAALVICLIAAIPLAAVLAALALFDLLPAAGRTPPDVIAVIALAYVVSVALMLRLSLLLPARATGNPSLSLKDAWRHTHGNLWRLFFGIVACTVPPVVLIKIIFIGLTVVPVGAGSISRNGRSPARSRSAAGCWSGRSGWAFSPTPTDTSSGRPSRRLIRSGSVHPSVRYCHRPCAGSHSSGRPS